jgi:hypothetical protein
MKKFILILMCFICTVGYTPATEPFPTTKSTEFIWKSNPVEFIYIGDTTFSQELLKKITLETMEIIDINCKDSIPHIPLTLTINGDYNNLLSTIEYTVSKNCSPTNGLQTTLFFDSTGNITSTFITFN